jgi:hypothetical protein
MVRSGGATFIASLAGKKKLRLSLPESAFDLMPRLDYGQSDSVQMLRKIRALRRFLMQNAQGFAFLTKM